MLKRLVYLFSVILVAIGLTACAAYENLTKKVDVVSMGVYRAIIKAGEPGYVPMQDSKEYYINAQPVFDLTGVTKITYKKDQQGRIWIVLHLKPAVFQAAEASKPSVPSGWVIYIQGELTSTVGVLNPADQSFVFRVSNESVAQRIIARLLSHETE